jgi:hypothetical protein
MRRLALLPLLLPLFTACNNDSMVNSAIGVNACATAIACKLLDPVLTPGLSVCSAQALSTNDVIVASASHFSTQMVNCIAAAGTSCDAARKCLNGGQTPDACTGAALSCSGNALSGCSPYAGVGGNSGTTKFDCGDVAQMCVVNAAVADCGVGTCAGGPGMCLGTKIQTCSNGVLKQYDCASYGDTCVVGALNIPHCRGTGAACQTQGLSSLGNTLRCDGTVLVRCADSQESRLDCRVRNQLCVANVNGESFGCALGSACNPSSFSATCSGAVLSYCNDGLFATYDCVAHGFTGCSPANGGACAQ